MSTLRNLLLDMGQLSDLYGLMDECLTSSTPLWINRKIMSFFSC